MKNQLLLLLLAFWGQMSAQSPDQQLWGLYTDGKLNKENIEQLLAQNADIDSVFFIPNTTLLIEASAALNVSAVALLLEHGADPNMFEGAALIEAIKSILIPTEDTYSKKFRSEIVSLLLAHNANFHAQDDQALRLAVQFGYDDIVLRLLEASWTTEPFNYKTIAAVLQFVQSKIDRLVRIPIDLETLFEKQLRPWITISALLKIYDHKLIQSAKVHGLRV